MLGREAAIRADRLSVSSTAEVRRCCGLDLIFAAFLLGTLRCAGGKAAHTV